MNHDLTEQIIKHVYSNLGIVKSNYIDFSKTKSLMSKDFLLSKEFSLKNIKNIWGCTLSLLDQSLQILLADTTQCNGIPEFALIVRTNDKATYGCYLICSDEVGTEPLIAFNVKDWSVCNAYLQAFFLATMEQIKESCLTLSNKTEYKEIYKLLLSFLTFHEEQYQNQDLEQEDI